MLQSIVENVIDVGLQGLGWVVMKGLSFGRYRGFRSGDALFEGSVGLGTILALGYGAYRLWAPVVSQRTPRGPSARPSSARCCRSDPGPGTGRRDRA